MEGYIFLDVTTGSIGGLLALKVMFARTEGSEHLDTFHLNPILHDADTIFTCVQLRLLVVL